MPQSRSGRRGWKRNPLPLSGIEHLSPDRPAGSRTLYCLSYRGTVTHTKFTRHQVYTLACSLTRLKLRILAISDAGITHETSPSTI
jgi:hypothetical protein